MCEVLDYQKKKEETESFFFGHDLCVTYHRCWKCDI